MFIFISVSFNTPYTSILKYVSLYVYIPCFIQQLQVSDLLLPCRSAIHYIWNIIVWRGKPVKGTQISSHFSVVYCCLCISWRNSHFSSKGLETDYKAAQGYFYKVSKQYLKVTLQKKENKIFKTFTSKKYRLVHRIF